MALPKPTDFTGTYEPLAYDRFSANLLWTPVDGADEYWIYRDLDKIVVEPPFETTVYNNQEYVIYRDTAAWTNAQPLDCFFWVQAVEGPDATGNYEEGDQTDALSLIHPFVIRIIEEARSMIGDDFRIFGNIASTGTDLLEQVSAYNYKVAVEQALSDINSTPTPTAYNYGTFPAMWKNLITVGTLVWMLPRLILFEKAKAMQFQDQGQEWTPPDLSESLKGLLDMYKDIYDDRRVAIKHNVRPMPKAVGSLRALFISPQLLKWRHVPTGRPYF